MLPLARAIHKIVFKDESTFRQLGDVHRDTPCVRRRRLAGGRHWDEHSFDRFTGT
jgi:hypothetical protein